MATERRQADLSQFSKEYLRACLAELDSQRVSLERVRLDLARRIGVLRDELRPLLGEENEVDRSLNSLQEKREPIEQRLREIERERKRRDFIQVVRQRLQKEGEALGQLDNRVVQALGRVIEAISQDERFVAVLPDLYEQGLTETRVFHNGDRISVLRADTDNCRVAFFGDGSYGIIYNSKPMPHTELQPYMELETRAVLSQVAAPEGFFVDKHVLGIRVDPTQKLPAIQPFALVRSVNGGQASYMTFSSSPELLAPVLSVISNILAQGSISLPKKFGSATLYRAKA